MRFYSSISLAFLLVAAVVAQDAGSDASTGVEQSNGRPVNLMDRILAKTSNQVLHALPVNVIPADLAASTTESTLEASSTAVVIPSDSSKTGEETSAADNVDDGADDSVSESEKDEPEAETSDHEKRKERNAPHNRHRRATQDGSGHLAPRMVRKPAGIARKYGAGGK